MRVILTILLFQLFNTACQSGSPAKPAGTKAIAAPAVTAVETYPMTPDTITIRGKFLPGCQMPDKIRIAIHNVENSYWKDVPVSKTGDFSYKHFLTEPRRIALRTIFGSKFDFFATANEKVYNVEITCSTTPGNDTFEIKGSGENNAYQAFSKANKKFQENLDTLAKKGISNPAAFPLLKQTVEEYQKTVADIAAANPNTFTAKIFCPMEKLPAGATASLEALRANFLNREAYANPQVYNDFLPQRILMNYVAIRERTPAEATRVIETLMAIAVRNPEAGKKLQEIVNNIFYSKHQEDLIIAYINWADRNPDKMYNPSIKARLQQLKPIVAGNSMMDFQLTDANGKVRKLSETVSTSKLTVLIFYSPNCGHCKEKVPTFLPSWEKYKNKGLKIVAVGTEGKDDEWRAFINTHGSAEWVNFHETETIPSPRPSDQYHAENPSFILIDAQGKILSRIGDPEYVQEEIAKKLE